jgi:hypothetical protein
MDRPLLASVMNGSPFEREQDHDSVMPRANHPQANSPSQAAKPLEHKRFQEPSTIA